ncbi:hypothetical protein [Moraxella phage Mcat22]|nr:hypothetical protein [Moraxella phage Mcat22]
MGSVLLNNLDQFHWLILCIINKMFINVNHNINKMRKNLIII